MALTTAGLKSAIKLELESKFGTPQEADYHDKFAEAVATAIINYLATNTVVTVTTTCGSGSGSGAGGIS